MINSIFMKLIDEIYPICRSITGEGVRETFKILQKYCPELSIYEIPSGTQVFDWKIPDEWYIEEGYIEDSTGKRIIDFRNRNLHVMSYSMPIDKWMGLNELKQYIYTLPEQPEWVPYVTSYYQRKVGFCMSQNLLESLDEKQKYHAVIKSGFKSDGSMTYGEVLIPGESEKEVFLSTYICHPSMGNNECSGLAVIIFLANYILNIKNRKYSYRIVIAPETIGAIAYLSKNLQLLKKNVIAGFILTCVGDNRNYSIVHSRYANNLADKVLKNVLEYSANNYQEFSFLKRGSDERQYCSPGVDLPVCTFCRTKYYEYPEYHTSADDLNLISEEGLSGSFEVMKKVINALENNYIYTTKCICEPQLGRRGLYPLTGIKGEYEEVRIIQDFLMYADGTNDLIDISNIIECPVEKLIKITEVLLQEQLIVVCKEKER